MKLVTFAGPPSSGKTSVIIKPIECLRQKEKNAGIVKFDCLTSFDHTDTESKISRFVSGIPARSARINFS